MNPKHSFSTLGIGLLLVAAAPAATPAGGWQSHLAPRLLAAYQASIAGGTATVQSLAGLRSDAQGRVQVDVTYDCSLAAPLAQLAGAGLAIGTSVKVLPLCVVEGWTAVSSLPQLAAVPGVKLIKAPAYAASHPPHASLGTGKAATTTSTNAKRGVIRAAPPAPPVIDGSAISIMRADQYIAQTLVTGAGVTVGVMSDDATSLQLIVSRGELPASAQDITPAANVNPSPTDEGTMMLEEVHAVAPGAQLVFCGSQTSTQYVGCLQSLLAQGATIVTDDISFPGEDLMSASGDMAFAVQGLLASAPQAALFTAAGNENGTYWEGPYVPVSLPSLGYPLWTCSENGQGDAYVEYFGAQYGQTLTISGTDPVPVILDWADPEGQNVSNFDVYVQKVGTQAMTCYSSAGTMTPQIYFNIPAGGGTYDIFVATPNTQFNNKFLKLIVPGDGATVLSVSTSGSILSPQAFVAGVSSVGAVYGGDGVGNTIEPFSALGPITLAFPQPAQIQAPGFVAPDAVYVDTAGTHFQPAPDGLFYGTSAASPNAASVAVLIRSAFPGLTPAQLNGAVQSGTVQLGASQPDSTFGYGRTDALGALGTIPPPAITGGMAAAVVGGTSSQSYPVTLGGTGNLHLSLTSTNAALVPAALAAAGSAGVAVSPATCGSGTNQCTLVFTPVLGKTGNAQVGVIVTDGANRKSTTSFAVTVSAPAMPTLSITSGASQSVTAGGTPSTVAFTLTGTKPIAVSASSSNTALLPAISISSGCGTSTLSCTATLSLASGQTGSANAQFTAQDPYAQTGSSSASVTVSPAAGGGGGGGSLDLLALQVLLALALRQGLVRARREVN